MSYSTYRTYTPLLYNKLLQHSECVVDIPAVYYTGQDVDNVSAIEIANYGNGENLSIECAKCHEIIIDFDRPSIGGE